MPCEVREPTCTATDEQDVRKLALLVVCECRRIAPQLVADPSRGLGPAVELKVEDDLASAEEVAAEAVRANGSAQRPLGGSLATPAPKSLVGASQASFDESIEEARDRPPMFEIGN
jgi:hypothetical protein